MNVKLDKDYFKAVEDGDLETAQKLVDEAADEWAYHSEVRNRDKLVKVYHGSPNGSFFKFDHQKNGLNTVAADTKLGFFFSESAEVAKLFGDVKSYYLDVKNPLMIENADFEEQLFGDGSIDWREFMESPEAHLNMDIIEGNAINNDGILVDATTKPQNPEFDFRVWIVKNPSQIKSADAVTYDDDGNVIPLSERFNPEKQDIRF